MNLNHGIIVDGKKGENNNKGMEVIVCVQVEYIYGCKWIQFN